MASIWETRDRFGRIVRLTEEGWDHIVSDRRGATPTPDDVRGAVEAPTRVTADADFAQRECSYQSLGAGRRTLKVVVHFRPVPPQGTWVGVVVTAFYVTSDKRREVQRWP